MALEDTVETGAQLCPPPRRGVGFVGLEIAIEPPDEGAQPLLRRVLLVGEGSGSPAAGSPDLG